MWDAESKGSIPTSIPISVCHNKSDAPPIAKIVPPRRPISNQ